MTLVDDVLNIASAYFNFWKNNPIIGLIVSLIASDVGLYLILNSKVVGWFRDR
jgi:hypothetical protein